MKSKTRSQIIETASELFYNRGFNLTGINEIIHESGIAKATLYNHFKSKEEILIAYLNRMDEILAQNLLAFIGRKSEGDKRIIAVLEFLIQIFNKNDFNGCWCIRTMAEVPRENKRVREKVKENKQKFYTILETIVNENKPLLNRTKRKLLTSQLYLLYEGAIIESHLLESDWPIKTAIGLLKDKLKQM